MTSLLSLVFQLLAALAGTIAFALLFRVPRKYYLLCGIIGVIGWAIYLILEKPAGSTFAIVAATVVVVFCSRLAAVIKKCPAVVFMISGLIPLIPGGGIYWTTYYLVFGEQELAMSTGYGALKAAVGIVLGIVFIGLVPQHFFQKLGNALAPSKRKQKRRY